MNRLGRLLLPAALAGIVAILMACDAPPQKASQAGIPASLETHPSILRDLQTIPHVAAEGVTGPNQTEFYVKKRSGDIRQFPCSACHSGLPALEASTEPVLQRTMHVDIPSEHADAGVMNCLTCHHPDDPGTLQSLTKTPIAIDHAYQLCSQCHFQQYEDWAGGAHGKRLAGWHGKRVILNCTECHNPHAPAFAHRYPDPGPRFPEQGASHHE